MTITAHFISRTYLFQFGLVQASLALYCTAPLIISICLVSLWQHRALNSQTPICHQVSVATQGRRWCYANCKLPIVSCKLRITNCKLRIANCKLHVRCCVANPSFHSNVSVFFLVCRVAKSEALRKKKSGTRIYFQNFVNAVALMSTQSLLSSCLLHPSILVHQDDLNSKMIPS